jgi:chemotaxis protein methyltransferase CheR
LSANREVLSLKQLEDDVVGFGKIADYLRRDVGINLTLSAKNQTLLASRMCKIMPRLGLANYHDLHLALASGRHEVRDAFISAITTNTTHFFREPAHFDLLARIFAEMRTKPELKKSREIRIWCAACSTGEEAYSIAMVAKRCLPANENWKLKFLASDIDREVLAVAARGVYPATSIDSVPQDCRQQFIERGVGVSSDCVRVRREIREMITFAQFNLMTPSYSFQNKFDLVFCRNVMIYFDRPEIQRTIEKLTSVLSVGGFLFLGHSETIMGGSPALKSRAAAVYERLPAGRKGEAA